LLYSLHARTGKKSTPNTLSTKVGVHGDKIDVETLGLEIIERPQYSAPFVRHEGIGPMAARIAGAIHHDGTRYSAVGEANASVAVIVR